MQGVESLGLVLIIAVVAAVLGVALGIFVVAPRIMRALDRADRPDEDDEESR